jgi:hypothetical protein
MRNQAWAEEAKLTTASKVVNDGASMATAEDARWGGVKKNESEGGNPSLCSRLRNEPLMLKAYKALVRGSGIAEK